MRRAPVRRAENDDEDEQEENDGSLERGRPRREEPDKEHGGQHDDADGEQPEGPELNRYHGVRSCNDTFRSFSHLNIFFDFIPFPFLLADAVSRENSHS